MELKQALKELREEKERKFKQSVDLIVNLKGIDLRKNNVNAVITIPHKIKEKKVCGFGVGRPEAGWRTAAGCAAENAARACARRACLRAVISCHPCTSNSVHLRAVQRGRRTVCGAVM